MSPSRRLELRGITKVFETPDGADVHRFTALDRVDIVFDTFSLHGILGENGAGKSTLMHVLSGLLRPTSGSILIDGEGTELSSAAEALKRGIAMVHQRPRLADSLTVLENALVGLPGMAARKKEREAALREISELWDLGLRLEAPAGSLDPGSRLRAALLGALFRKPDFLILDEPTAVLSREEGERFMASARRAASEGMGIILVTHKLDEALRWADRVTVLRRGSVAFDAAAPSPEEAVPVSRSTLTALLNPLENADAPREAPVGAGVRASQSGGDSQSRGDSRMRQGAEKKQAAPPALTASSLSARPRDRDSLSQVSFSARSGSVTGIFGVPGSGLSTLEDLLSGMIRGDSGTLTVRGARAPETRLDARRLTPASLRRAGIAFVPSDRNRRGSDPSLSVRDILLPYRMKGLARHPAEEILMTRETLGAARVEALPTRTAGSLSGGQLQRLVLARELDARPAVLILCEPEWGLDIRSVADLRKRLRDAADGGVAVVILTDSPETVGAEGLYDETFVLREGVLR